MVKASSAPAAGHLQKTPQLQVGPSNTRSPGTAATGAHLIQNSIQLVQIQAQQGHIKTNLWSL